MCLAIQATLPPHRNQPRWCATIASGLSFIYVMHTLHPRTHRFAPNPIPSAQTIPPTFNLITLFAMAHIQSWLTNFVCGMNAPARSERPQAFNKVIRLWEGTHHGYQGNKVLSRISTSSPMRLTISATLPTHRNHPTRFQVCNNWFGFPFII